MRQQPDYHLTLLFSKTEQAPAANILILPRAQEALATRRGHFRNRVARRAELALR